jgi:DNA-binding beta-propeller fold protein YncE
MLGQLQKLRGYVPRLSLLSALPVFFCAAVPLNAVRSDEGQSKETYIPTGQRITPTAANGAIFQELNPKLPGAPELRANHAAAAAVSRDGKTLVILTSGSSRSYGRDLKVVPELSNEYVFVFDVTGEQPRELQVLMLPHTFQGLVWAHSSDRFFVSGGQDDTVVEFVRNGSDFARGRTFSLGHKGCVGLDGSKTGMGFLNDCGPVTAGLALSPDGTKLLVANLENDSVSVVDLGSGQVVVEQDLRPGIIDAKRRGQPGGSFPRSVVWSGRDRAYVASERDREVISLAISNAKIRVVRRIPVPGQPVALLANRAGTRVYAALATTGKLAVIDANRDVLIEALDLSAPPSLYANSKRLGGANSNALALTPNEGTLLVSNGGENAVAVVRLSEAAKGASSRHNDQESASKEGDGDDKHKDGEIQRSSLIGLVPTGWYPAGVAVSKNGGTWYVVNGKSEPGPSTGWCKQLDSQKHCVVDNYDVPAPYAADGFAVLDVAHENAWQLEKAGFLAMPAPGVRELGRLTKQVAHDNGFDQAKRSAADERLFAFLRAHIKHVIYIIKENRTYDQVFGDLEIGNGDPRLTFFPESISPNHHALARNFVTLDNFLVSGEGSWEGWDWSISAQTNDYRERIPAGGMRGEQTGFNRNINLAQGTAQERHAEFALSPSDPDILPSSRDVTAPDGPGGEEGKGFLWDVALRAGLTIRNWGCWGENRAFPKPAIQLVHDPYAKKQQVFFPTRPSLVNNSDPYYLDFGPAYPDFWRVKEWKREFAEFVAKKSAPGLMLVRLGNDHLGSFESAIDGVNTPETQMADNDYALALMVEAVANSPFASDTLIMSIEDDAADGPDHVDARRSVMLFAGPYVKQHALISTHYTTVNVVKTIEEILGTGPIGLNDDLAAPMSDVFDTSVTNWSYKPIVPEVLRTTRLPLPSSQRASKAVPRHSSGYWAAAMAGQDFSQADHLDNDAFNRALWRGLKGDTPYPATPSGADLRANRASLLERAKSAEHSDRQ